MLNLLTTIIFNRLILFASITLLISCKHPSIKNSEHQDGLVDVVAGTSKYDSQYIKAAGLLYDNKISEAISIYENLCSIEDDTAKTYAYMCLGSAYLMENDYHHALQNYTLSIKYNNQNIDSYVGLGSVYFNLHDYERAVECYNNAKSIDSSNANIYWGLAISYDLLKMADKAKMNASHFIKLEPHSKYRGFAESILNK